jgi:glycosyltransferase involved in cell wall biosynthesis
VWKLRPHDKDDMRLLILTSAFPRWTGDDTTPFVRHFAENMAQRCTDVVVVAPHHVGARTRERLGEGIRVSRFRYFFPPRHADIAYGGNAVSRVSRSPLYVVKLASFFLVSLLRAVFNRASVLNAHWLIPQGVVAVLAAALTRQKVVVTVHGGDVFSLNSPLLRRVKRFALRRADAVVVNSTATRAACRELYAGREYATIPMGVDTERFRPEPRSPELVERYGLGDFTVLFVGRLTKDKGVAYLLAALERFKASGADFKALIVGSGDQEAALKEFVAEHGLTDDVVFTGWVPSEELVDYYNTADVFVGPSIVGDKGWEEALGLVFVEALATGLPVVTTRTGGIGDVVEDGVTGFMVDQRSADQLAERLTALYEDRELLARLGRNGRTVVEKKFSWATVADRYEAVFRDVVGRSSPAS